jgi:nitroimidazol reductase NimA-like FMN-containing flavoprotein (pyridoxamine 5'-phosphate oxidase superfamily)
MRRKDRDVTNLEKMKEIMKACDCCRIGMADESGVYIVPLNFGFKEEDGQVTLYFHSAGTGRKIDLLRKQTKVGFEMDTKHELVVGDVACDYSYLFQSIIGEGEITILTDLEEKREGLGFIMSQYSDKEEWEFEEAMLKRVCVMKMIVSQYSCKEH